MESFTWVPVILYYLPEDTSSCWSATAEDLTQSVKQIGRAQNQSESSGQCEKWKSYLQIFEKELAKNMEKFEKKKWEESQDHLLIQLRQQGLNWVEISKRLQKTNPQICKRRYTRLIEAEKKWPRVVDELIKNCYEDQNKDWDEIQAMILQQSRAQFVNYSIKRIKERYFLHLRSGIQQREWSIPEDLLLLNLIRQQGKKWKELTCEFQGRTELQLKNRYNGTLKLMEKRVLRKLKSQAKRKERGQPI